MNRPAKLWLQTGLITVVCVIAYFGIRLIPVEPCDFLHYGDYVNADGIIEGCGYEETQFFDMDSLRFPIVARIIPIGEVAAGEKALFQLTLFTTQGRPIRAEDIAVSHTEKVHALIVDPTLDDYQHIHPQPAGPPGHYLFEMKPRHAGVYQVYLDFILLTTNRRTLVASQLEVTEGPRPAARSRGSAYRFGPYAFTMRPEGGPPRAGEDVVLHLEVSHSEGAPFLFQPVMGSYAHLVAFEAGRRGFAHLHPRNPLPELQDPANPDLSFSIRVDHPGTYRIWAQLMIEEQEMLIPFDLEIGV